MRPFASAVFLLAANESPDFVQFASPGGHVDDIGFEEVIAFLTNKQDQVADRVRFHASQTRASADTQAFKQHAQNYDCVVHVDSHVSKWPFFAADESCAAFSALPALIAFAIFTVFRAVGVLACWSDH